MIRPTLNPDSPWRRLPWTLPSAILIWVAAMLGLTYFMGNSTQRSLERSPIDARFIEQSVPPVKQNVQVERQRKPRPASSAPRENPYRGQNQAAQKQEMTPNIITAAPGGASPGDFSVPGGVQSANPSANTGTEAGSHDGKGKSGGNMYANGGARAIIRPMPQIPDDMREGAFNFAALARFHVAADGSAKVELAKPTPDPRLNSILLESLRKWRFMPAIRNGKPVASTEEIVIKIEVK